MSNKLKLDLSEQMYEHALSIIPGAIAGIRRPYNFVPGEYPIYFDSAKGGRVTDVDGNEYIDFLCAYGPIIIGHREEEIDNAVIDQMRNKGFCFSLTQPIQNKLAEKLIELIPSAEMAVFVKTGSDATSVAVRVARANTDRVKIARCGYHGWHDWCVEVKGGVPKKLWEDTYDFHYNNLEELEDLMKKHGDDMAAIIITPVGHPLGDKVQMPKPGFLEGVRALADKYGTVLIFDEIRSGFRYSLGGAQKVFGVTPDISVFGKALANGYPIGVVVGKEKNMNVLADKVFLSSTFFPNSLEQVAAVKTIEILERDNILDKIREKGQFFGNLITDVCAKSGFDVEVSGVPLMPFITFNKDPQQLYKKLRPAFYTELIRRNVFLQPYHHGYIAYRHSEEDLIFAANMIAESFEAIKQYKF
jgi:glutamate-1-semialdehyde aminotransferase